LVNSLRKGASAERKIAALIAMHRGITLKRNLDHADSWLDCAGYIALGGEIATAE